VLSSGVCQYVPPKRQFPSVDISVLILTIVGIFINIFYYSLPFNIIFRHPVAQHLL
jgi:hypothetical protein